MKSVILAAAAFAFTSTAALAWDIGVSGEAAYSVENEALSLEVGPDLAVGGIGLAPRVYGSLDADAFSFDGVGVEATYGVTSSITVFGAVQSDGDWKYSDAQVGLRFQF